MAIALLTSCVTCNATEVRLVLDADSDADHPDDTVNDYGEVLQDMQQDLTSRLVLSGYGTGGGINGPAFEAARVMSLACSTGFVGTAQHLQSIIELGGWPVCIMQQCLQAWQPQLQRVGQHAVEQHIDGFERIVANTDKMWSPVQL